MCFGTQTRQETIPSTVDFSAMEEAVFSPVQTELQPFAEDVQPFETQPDFEVVIMGGPLNGAGDINDLFEQIFGGPSPFLGNVNPAFLESEPGAVELGPMDNITNDDINDALQSLLTSSPIDVLKASKPEPSTVADLMIQLSDMPLDAKAYFDGNLITKVERRNGCGGEYVKLVAAPVE